ncbi:MAG TPA: flagellar biosynthesis protein FliQ, partial [Arenibaculum sp.]|nr:flagellar biosynthesis protein FliQ [Arenibaculum sp.]
DVMREAIVVMIKMGGPVMILTLVIGLMVSIFQALTQIQEMTLTFVPKIMAVFAALLLLMPFMLATLVTFTEQIADRIIGLGTGG